jgi:hypothetical protein
MNASITAQQRSVQFFFATSGGNFFKSMVQPRVTKNRQFFCPSQNYQPIFTPLPETKKMKYGPRARPRGINYSKLHQVMRLYMLGSEFHACIHPESNNRRPCSQRAFLSFLCVRILVHCLAAFTTRAARSAHGDADGEGRGLNALLIRPSARG